MLGAGTALVAGSVATLGGQVLWTAHRKLPSLIGLDASGWIPGTADGPVLRVVALGDSTLTGPGLAGPEEIWLRVALADLALPYPVDLVSLAVGGSRLAQVRAAADHALELEPDVVVVAAGSNDAIHGTNVRAFADGLDELITTLLQGTSAIGVGNVGDLGNVVRVPQPLSSVLRQRSISISRRIEQVVGRHDRAILLDVTASDVGFRDRGVFGEDLFHPNRTGHQLWADAARPGLARLLAEARGDHPRTWSCDDPAPESEATGSI